MPGNDVPKDKYDCKEVSSEEIDKALNNSEFLVHDYNGDDDRLRQVDLKNRRIMKEAGGKINDEWGWVRKTLILRIKLYDIGNGTNERVKYIEVASGYKENIIECCLEEDGNITWKYTKKCKSFQLWKFLKTIWSAACYAGMQIMSSFFKDGVLLFISELLKYCVPRALGIIKNKLDRIRPKDGISDTTK